MYVEKDAFTICNVKTALQNGILIPKRSIFLFSIIQCNHLNINDINLYSLYSNYIIFIFNIILLFLIFDCKQ